LYECFYSDDVLFRICPVLGLAVSELIAQVERARYSRGK
jgi:hypothetical protein